MLKKMGCAVLLCLTMQTGHAALIEHNGFKRDSGSNIVSGGGLEWLKWDLTNYMTVNQALAAYGSPANGGWQLATESQFGTMLNQFKLTDNDWTTSDDLQLISPWDQNEESATNQLIKLFGFTYSADCDFKPKDCLPGKDSFVSTGAIFGKKTDTSIHSTFTLFEDNSYFNGDYWVYTDTYLHKIMQEQDYSDYQNSQYGIALVRTARNDTPAPVSAPATSGILILGVFFLLLLYRSRI